MSDKNKQKIFVKFLKVCIKRYENNPKNIILAGEYFCEPYKVLITTILSAQNKDSLTIPISIKLFEKFNSLKKLSEANFNQIFQIIKSINYNKTKTKNVISTSRILINKFNGEIPKTMDELLTLNGVGRKTANLVLGECFKIPSICVDTHVHRICNIFNFVKTKTPEETEFALRKLVPKKYWISINNNLVRLGQEISGNDKKKFEKLLNIEI